MRCERTRSIPRGLERELLDDRHRKGRFLLIEFNLPTVDVKHLNVLVRALCALDVLYLRAHPNTPLLKASGVRYQTQPRGCERFRTVPDVLAAGSGDCDQLAPWRAAELRVKQGIRALPEVRRMSTNLWHVYVRMPDGSVEDISAHLGMPVPANLARIGRAILSRKTGYASDPRSPRLAVSGQHR